MPTDQEFRHCAQSRSWSDDPAMGFDTHKGCLWSGRSEGALAAGVPHPYVDASTARYGPSVRVAGVCATLLLTSSPEWTVRGPLIVLLSVSDRVPGGTIAKMCRLCASSNGPLTLGSFPPWPTVRAGHTASPHRMPTQDHASGPPGGQVATRRSRRGRDPRPPMAPTRNAGAAGIHQWRGSP